MPAEVLQPEKTLRREAPQPLPRSRISKTRLVLAFAIAALADGLAFVLVFTPPLQWVVDLVTAILLFIVLGWQWILLPGLIMEAIPGLNVFPLWVLVVGTVAISGSVRHKLKEHN